MKLRSLSLKISSIVAIVVLSACNSLRTDSSLLKERAVEMVRSKIKSGVADNNTLYSHAVGLFSYIELQGQENGIPVPCSDSVFPVKHNYDAKVVSEAQIDVSIQLQVTTNNSECLNFVKTVFGRSDCLETPAEFRVLLDSKEVLPRNSCAEDLIG